MILLVMSYAMSQSRRLALASAAGVVLGDAVAMIASLAGLGALGLASATLFKARNWIGAVYLVWMGWKHLRSAGSARLGDLDLAREVPSHEVFGHAALVMVLNPKDIVFFVAFVPQFVRPAQPPLP